MASANGLNSFSTPDALYKGPNGHVKSLSDAAAVTYNSTRGRHLVATQDIPAGSLIIREVPYAFCVHDACAEWVCQHCAEPLPADRLRFQCKSCKDDKVVFCSAECYEGALDAYHFSECNLQFVGITRDTILLGFRILLQTSVDAIVNYYEHKGDYFGENLQPIRTHDERFRSLMRLMAIDVEDSSEEQGTSASQQQPADPTHKLGKLAKFLVRRLVKQNFSADDKGWPAKYSQEQRAALLESVMIDILLRLRRNRQGVWEFRKYDDPGLMKALKATDCHKGTGIYPVGALMNHSCSPNTHMTSNRNALVEVRAIHNIKAGEEITHSYGPHVGESKRRERQAKLKEDFFFDCTCEACTSEEYAVMESEMEALWCKNCTKIITDSQNGKCADCSLSVSPADVKNKMDSAKVLHAAACIEDKDASNNAENVKKNIAQMLEVLDWLEAHLHTHHKQLNSLRGDISDFLIKKGEFQAAEPILKHYVTTEKRHFGIMSLNAAWAWRRSVDPLELMHVSGIIHPQQLRVQKRLSRVYAAKDSSSNLYVVTVALVIRIYVNHYGRSNVEQLFRDGGMDEFAELLHKMTF